MIAGAITFALGNIIAIILYPNYSFSGNSFSDLGIRQDTFFPETNAFVSAAPYPEIFNVTLYICGLLIIPFFIAAYSVLKDNNNNNIFLLISGITGLSIGPLLIGVGVYDMAKDLDAHGDFATTLMMMIGFTSLFWALGVVFLGRESEYKQFRTWYLDPLFAFFIMFVTWVLVWGKPNVILLKNISFQVYQKMVALSFIPYYSIVGLRLLKIIKNG